MKQLQILSLSCLVLIWHRISIVVCFDHSLSVINYGHLQSNVMEIKRREEMRLKYAMESIGFFVITNHGINHDVLDKAWNDSIEFFDTNESNKNSVPMSKEYIYGYQNKEILSRSEGDINTVSLDQKETFQVYIGAPNTDRYKDVLWPKYPFNMNISWTAYYRELEILVNGILRSIASILNLESIDFFEQYNNDHLTALRAANYPSIDGNENADIKIRCSSHSDWGILTLLRQDNVGGLQIENKTNNEWIDVSTDFYDFVVNIGDLLARWSNHQFKSTRHRVVNYIKDRNSGNHLKITKRRQAMAFFYIINGDAEINVLSTWLNTNETSEYESVTVKDYLESKHLSTQIYHDI